MAFLDFFRKKGVVVALLIVAALQVFVPSWLAPVLTYAMWGISLQWLVGALFAIAAYARFEQR